MIDIYSAKSYKDEVKTLYSLLEKDGWSNLKTFEWRYRKIHLLNGKIRNNAARTKKDDGEYSTCTY